MKITRVYFGLILVFIAVIPAIKSLCLVSYYEQNKSYIIENFCINKEKPELKCDGKCHLASILTVKTTKSEPNSSNVPSEYFQLFKYELIAVAPHDNILNLNYSVDSKASAFQINNVRLIPNAFIPVLNPPPEQLF